MKFNTNSNTVGFNPMMTMLENGMLVEKGNNFNLASNSLINNSSSFEGKSEYQSSSPAKMQQGSNSLFSNFPDEFSNQTNRFNTNNYFPFKENCNANNLVNNSNINNNYFQFNPTESLVNTDLLDYNFFTRFSNLIENNQHSFGSASSSAAFTNNNLASHGNSFNPFSLQQNTLFSTLSHLNQQQQQQGDATIEHNLNYCSYCSNTCDTNLTQLECNIHKICRKCFKASLSTASSSSSMSSRKNSDSKCDMKLMATSLVKASSNEVNCLNNTHVSIFKAFGICFFFLFNQSIKMNLKHLFNQESNHKIILIIIVLSYLKKIK